MNIRWAPPIEPLFYWFVLWYLSCFIANLIWCIGGGGGVEIFVLIPLLNCSSLFHFQTFPLSQPFAVVHCTVGVNIELVNAKLTGAGWNRSKEDACRHATAQTKNRFSPFPWQPFFVTLPTFGGSGILLLKAWLTSNWAHFKTKDGISYLSYCRYIEISWCHQLHWLLKMIWAVLNLALHTMYYVYSGGPTFSFPRPYNWKDRVQNMLNEVSKKSLISS